MTTLLLFTAVNAAAYPIKQREPEAAGALAVPLSLPAIAFGLNLLVLGFAVGRFF